VTTVSPIFSGICCADGSDPSSEADPVGKVVDGSSGGMGVVPLDVAPVDVVTCSGGIGIGCCCWCGCTGCCCTSGIGGGGGAPYSIPGYCPAYLIPGY
jgi:hypothetical protein